MVCPHYKSKLYFVCNHCNYFESIYEQKRVKFFHVLTNCIFNGQCNMVNCKAFPSAENAKANVNINDKTLKELLKFLEKKLPCLQNNKKECIYQAKDKCTKCLNEHEERLNKYNEYFIKNKQCLNKHEERLNKHEDYLDENAKILNEFKKKLNKIYNFLSDTFNPQFEDEYDEDNSKLNNATNSSNNTKPNNSNKSNDTINPNNIDKSIKEMDVV